MFIVAPSSTLLSIPKLTLTLAKDLGVHPGHRAFPLLTANAALGLPAAHTAVNI